MQYTIATVCVLSLLAASYAVGPHLSPSFSYQGTAVSTVTDGASVTTLLTHTYM